MNLLKIPFVRTVGIVKEANGNSLELPYINAVHNHLQTIHASAQFTLAETSSGELLQSLFPELEGKIIPVLRESKVKFKSPATKNIFAYSLVSDESRARFSEKFAKQGRALILVEVEVKDSDGIVTLVGTFNWFLQKIST